MDDELIDQRDRDYLTEQKYLSRAPGDAATKAYIANKYLSGGGGDDDKKKKKKKKKSVIGNIGIVDEDEWGWAKEEQPRSSKKKTSMSVSTARPSHWKPMAAAAASDDDDVQGDDDESRPVVVATEIDDIPMDESKPRMSSGQKAGLLTSKEIRAEAERARRLESDAMKHVQHQQEQETIYRDSSGKKIDMKLAKAEEMRARQKENEKKERQMEWGKGLVQRDEEQRRRQQLEDEKHKPMARYANDSDLNQELKDQERWNDPGAAFITKKKPSASKKMVQPTYKGPWKPNRFMIPPGYRWDGVDRSNGYEDKLLLHMNQQKSFKAEAHAWSTEDM
ncbi:Pre-mRNA-splicing factor of RES complex-domain-containing protein [Gongronella butleri]|nr:Pre-mRNA-splicing factor of RES complex-domain-containing protein [Gongronella butleri]